MKPCIHSELRRAKTGGWFCVEPGCDFEIAEPVQPRPVVYSPCHAHMGMPFTMTITPCAPPIVVCPLCDPAEYGICPECSLGTDEQGRRLHRVGCPTHKRKAHR